MQKINVSCCATTLVTRASFFALHAYFTSILLFFIFSSFLLFLCDMYNMQYECSLLLFFAFCSGYRCVGRFENRGVHNFPSWSKSDMVAIFPKLFICTNNRNDLKSICKLAKLAKRKEMLRNLMH